MSTKEQRLSHKLYNQYMTILEEFKPPKKINSDKYYEVDDYYGVGFMKEKKSNKYNVKLLYDYHDGNSKVGSSLLLDTLDEAIEIVRIMEEFAVDKSTKKKAKFDFSNVKDYKSSHIEPISIEDEEKARKIASIKKEVFY